MIGGGFGTGMGGGRGRVNVASVNLKRLPSRNATGRDTGEAVDARYLSEFLPTCFFCAFWGCFLGEKGEGGEGEGMFGIGKGG